MWNSASITLRPASHSHDNRVNDTFRAPSVQQSKACAKWTLIINILSEIYLSPIHIYFSLLLISADKPSVITVANSPWQKVLHQIDTRPSASDQCFPNANIWTTNWLISSEQRFIDKLPTPTSTNCALTNWNQVTHICFSELSHHWIRQWLVSCSASSHYLNQPRHVFN